MIRDIYELDSAALSARLLDSAGSSWPSLEDAIAFAGKHHDGQMRRNGEPTMHHVLRTSLLLHELAEQKDANVLCAGVLHDVVEDTEASLDDVEDAFGGRVGDLVRALTHPDLQPGEDSHARNLRWFEAMRWEGRDVHIVKSADRLDNLHTMDGAFDDARRATYLAETRDALLPLTLASNTALYHALNDFLEEVGA